MNHPVAIGKLGSAFGVHGWLRVHSFTDPIDNIINYHDWHTKVRDQWQPLAVEACKRHGKHILVKLKGIDSPEAAKKHVNQEVWVERDQFADTEADEYYWTDLIGCNVQSPDGKLIGCVKEMIETGSNDVFVILDDNKKRHLIPHLDGVILSVDINNKLIVADWPST